ncbi:adenylate cyclase [uncultured Parasphingorhabdus sp.]|uniref:adenylate cyclase n=1 Tax=uncultured Parasphingorhabdus sp. TaxID=2709694 RepID=UPI0030DD4CA8|tara:strand:+ start:19236 stop:19949 length:714 start_codon:yes stop_codon:yes gene_type:complete
MNRAMEYALDQRFFVRFSIILAAVIIFGFAQFSMRGMVNFQAVPRWVHLHGILMLGWLGLIVAQNILIQRGKTALHRKIGWLGGGLALIICVTGLYTGYMAVQLQRFPPFFNGSYFLALVLVEMLVFAAMVVWAIMLRRQTQWHRRIMIGATLIALEPAFGRLLPMPLLGDWGEWLILLCQLVFVVVLARHDQKIIGHIHPATLATGAIVTAAHVVTTGLSLFPPFQRIAESIGGAG